ncbi:response regulator [Sunxiuqinia sp. A32]|uniref:response regulator n=1 Tax=Sunxiuqinia sp. A32 TaxID=3461496 RepID=UPI0040453899
MKILIVDDNPVNQKFATLSLHNDYDIETADHGLEALEKVQVKKYDLILMDLFMPIMDGAEATLKIRQLDSNLNKNIPIVFYTTSDLESDRRKCLQYGANDYLIKPLKAGYLQKRIKHILKI